ncbi:Translin [Panaeolus papilionaceus]|nr:Translin [Panaeolus papilionaceus]
MHSSLITTSAVVNNVNNKTQSLFHDFRDELDKHHERRERLIKASRDITNTSKKVIFALHRTALEEQDKLVQHPGRDAAIKAYESLREVQDIYEKLQSELQGDNFWRYERQVSPGLQEYIEALSFAHYLNHGTLITYDQVQQTLVDSHGTAYFPLTISDYILGLSDLTGELMRYAISSITKKGDFERMTPYIRDLNKKQAVTTQSLEKIEDAAYTIVLRSSEYELPPDMLDEIVARVISTHTSRPADFSMD